MTTKATTANIANIANKYPINQDKPITAQRMVQ